MGEILEIYWKFLYIIIILLLIFWIPILALIKLKKADKSQWTAKEILVVTMKKMQMSNQVICNDEFINDYVDKNSGDLHLNNKLANSKNLICVSKVYQLIIDTDKKIKRHILDHYFVFIHLIFTMLILLGGFVENHHYLHDLVYSGFSVVLIIVSLYILYYIFSKGRKRNLIYKNHISLVLASTNFTDKQKDAIQYLVYHRCTLELFRIIYLIFPKE